MPASPVVCVCVMLGWVRGGKGFGRLFRVFRSCVHDVLCGEQMRALLWCRRYAMGLAAVAGLALIGVAAVAMSGDSAHEPVALQVSTSSVLFLAIILGAAAPH